MTEMAKLDRDRVPCRWRKKTSRPIHQAQLRNLYLMPKPKPKRWKWTEREPLGKPQFLLGAKREGQLDLEIRSQESLKLNDRDQERLTRKMIGL